VSLVAEAAGVLEEGRADELDEELEAVEFVGTSATALP